MLQLVITDRARARVGAKVIELIEHNVEAGVDRTGTPFTPYSSRPFARPAGGIPQAALASLKKVGGLHFLNRGDGKKKWVVITGGYVALKSAWRPSAGGRVDLTLKGVMMRDLAILSSADGRIVIGFTSEKAAEEAYFHVVAGAGKARTIRDFLGLTDEQWTAVAAVLGEDGAVTLTGGL